MKIYEGVGANSGKTVSVEDAFEYALATLNRNKSEQTEFLEWFYSGNWIQREVRHEAQ